MFAAHVSGAQETTWTICCAGTQIRTTARILWAAIAIVKDGRPAMTDEQIQEIRALCDGVTPGPWNKIIRKDKQIYCGNEFKPVAAVCELYDDESEANLRFISTARQIIPELLKEIEQLNSLDKVRVAAFIKMTAERDHWKARVERLGRAMQSEDECRFCVKKDRIEACTARAYAPGCDWQFDEARFAAEINHD